MAAATTTLIALQGETVDALVWRAIRKGPAAVEVVLQANPHLAEQGVFLPAGLAVSIPADASAPATRPMINLWN